MPHTEGYQLRSLLDEAWCMSNDSLGVDPFTEQRYSRFLDELRKRGQTALPLIAAAPEMLEMLESVETCLESIAVDEQLKAAGLLQGPMVGRTLSLMRPLLRKARGESPATEPPPNQET